MLYAVLLNLIKMLQRNHKAKRLDTGRWINGFYSSYSDVKGNGNYQIRSNNGYQNDVDFTTVSQWTGLLDSQENRIYENDIVEFVYLQIYKVIGVVNLNQWGHSQVEAKIVTMNGTNSRKDFKNGLDFHIENAVKGKVIGNIFDNAELLETVAQHSI